jgi:hypothetical protein
MKKIVELPNNVRIYSCPYGEYVIDENGDMTSPEKYRAFKELEAWMKKPEGFWYNMVEGITQPYG